MFQINARDGLRDKMSRLNAARPIGVTSGSYNTGGTVTAADALIYVKIQLAHLLAREPSEWNAVEATWVNCQPTTAAGLGLVRAMQRWTTEQPGQEEAVTPATIVNTVRNVFALSVSDAAAVFRVSRPTIYQWMKLDDMEQVRAHEDRERMKALFRVSKHWAQRGRLVGRWQQEVLPSGISVLDLLTAKDLNVNALLTAHSVLSARSAALRKAEHKRAQDAAGALKEAFAKMGEAQEARMNKEGL